MSLTENLRDAAYTAIGMGVISVQRAQVQREELRKRVAETLKDADARLAPVVNAVDSQFDAIVSRLPEQAKQFVEPALQVGKDVREQVRARVASA